MDIGKLIEQYFEGTLSFEEEEALCSYLRENEVPEPMQRDKEAVLAMCACVDDLSLPQGAAARLEAMLDELESNSLAVGESGQQSTVPIIKKKKVPIVWRVAVAAAVALLVLLALPRGGETESLATILTEQPEEDTFDNPEDAMLCFKAAFGDMLLAANTTQRNARTIGAELQQVAIMSGMR